MNGAEQQRRLEAPCARCAAGLSIAIEAVDTRIACPNCATPTELHVFPAFFRTSSEKAAEAVLGAEESSCFFHPAKRAAVACSHCGRFLCTLCDIEVGGRHLCPQCLQAPEQQQALHVPRHFVRYDSLALFLAIVPILFYPLTLFTAPAVLFIALRYWNAPRSIAPRSRMRFVLAILISLLQILAWGVLIAAIIADAVEG